MSKRFAGLRPKATLTAREVVYGRLWLMRNGIPSQAMDTLAAGPFLAACAVSLGAPNLVIGVLAAVPHLIQFVQFFGIYLIERYRTRRLIAVLAGFGARLMYLPMIAAVLLDNSGIAIALLVVAVALRYSFGAVVTAAWNAWIPELIPETQRSEFVARRLRLMAIVGIGLSFAAAALVDSWANWSPRGGHYAYATLFATALLAGFASLYCMMKMPERTMAEASGKMQFARNLMRPLRDPNFRRLLLFLGPWNFAVNLAAPFFTVYMLTLLDLQLTIVTGLMVMSQFANVLVLREWGRIADRFSNKSVLAICGPLFIVCIFAWTFTTFPERHALTLPLLALVHVLMGVATAGVTLASTTIAMKLAPPEERTAYMASSSMINSVAAGAAPIIGGLFADFFVNRELSLVIKWTAPGGETSIPAIYIGHWDFFFLIAVVIGIYSVHRLALVREVGEVSENVVVGEFLADTKRAVRSFSTIAGLRMATEAPVSVLRRAFRRRRLGDPADR